MTDPLSCDIKVKNTRQEASLDETLDGDLQRLGKGAAVALSGRIGGRVLLLVNQVILARVLGPADFGLYALGWTVLQMTSLVAPLGTHDGIIRFGVPAWGKDKGLLRAVLQRGLRFSATLGIIAGLSLLLGAGWLADAVFQKPGLTPVFRGFALAVMMAVPLRVVAAATRISQRMQFSVLAEDVAQPAAQIVFIVVLVLVADYRLGAAVVSAAVGFAVALALGGLFLWRLFGKDIRCAPPAPFPLRELIAFSLPASLASIFTLLTFYADRLLVGYFLSASEVGVYQAASQAAMLSAMILGSLNAIFSPMIARLYYKSNLARLDALFKVSTKWGLYVSLPPFLVLAIAPREVITIVFGEAYGAGTAAMLIMAAAQLFNAATGAVGLLLIMSGNQREWLILSAISFGSNILLCGVLIPRFGITGAALAAAASVMLLFSGGLYKVRRVLGLWPYDRRYLKGMASALGMLVLLWLGKSWFPPDTHGALWLIVWAASGTIIFGVFILLRPDTEDRVFLRQILARIQGTRR